MIQRIAEHYFEDSLLFEGCNVLDIGCRNFAFTDWMELSGYKVFPVDCDYLNANQFYYRLAITNTNGIVHGLRSSDPQGTKIVYEGSYSVNNGLFYVQSLSLFAFSDMVGVKMWELIKIDAEGSEREIIMGLSKPPAKSLSIEFHLHTGAYGDAEVKQMEDKLISLGYFPVKHDKTNEHGAGFNYWSSLWILKEYIK